MSYNRPKHLSIILLMLIGTGLLMQSCYKEKFKVGQTEGPLYNPTWAIPLVDSRMVVEDILGRIDDEDIIVWDPVTQLLAIKYFDNILSIPADTFLLLTDQSASISQEIPGGPIESTPVGTTVPVDVPIDVPFTPPTAEEFERVILKNGTLAYTISSTFPHPATDVVVSIPGLTDPSGTSYTRSFPTLAVGSPASEAGLDLTGWTLDLSATGSFNEFRIDFSADFTNSGATAGPGDGLEVDFTVAEPRIKEAYGDFKTNVIETGIDSVRLRIFEDAIEGTINYADPRLKAIFTNTYGAPIEVTINRLAGWVPPSTAFPVAGVADLVEGGTVSISSPASVGMIPTMEGDTFELNVTNSNLQLVFAERPQKLVYDVEARTNPAGGVSSNFVVDTSRVKLDVEVYLPFEGSMVDFVRDDTIEFNMFSSADTDSLLTDSSVTGFPLIDSVEQIKMLTIRFNMDNHFACDGKAQGYFYHRDTLTGDITEVATVFDGGPQTIIASGVTDPSGKVIAASRATTDIVITPAKIRALQDGEVNLIVIRSFLDTPEGGDPIKVFKTDYLDIKIGLMIEFEAMLDSLINF